MNNSDDLNNGQAPVREDRGRIDASDYVVLGKTCLASGAYHDAEAYARQASLSGSQNGLALLAVVLRRIGKPEEAAKIRARISAVDDPELESEIRLLDIGIGVDSGRYRECIERFDDPQGLVCGRIADIRVSTNLGICHYRLNNLDTARMRFQWAVEQSEIIGWKEGIAGGLLNLGLIDRIEGSWSVAEKRLLAAKKAFAHVGHMRGYTISCLNLGLQRLWQGSLTLAETDLSEAARLATETGDTPVQCSARMDRGLTLVRLTDLGGARKELASALRLCRQASPRRLAVALEYTGELHIAEGNWTRADAVLRRALAIANRIAPEGDIVPEVLRRQAEVALGTGNPRKALEIAKDASARATKSGDRYENATALRVIGQAERALGHEPEAVATFRSALSTLEELGETFERDRIIALLDAGEGKGSDKKRSSPRIESPQSREMQELLREHGMIGSSRRMQDLMRQITLVAPIQLPVLIQGETGTGKELVARAIHTIGTSPGAPLIAFNCATCPPELLDAELFGFNRGAFTGAHAKRTGLVRSAQGGSLFLDEIGELREESQARLLRMLDSGEVRPLGSDKSVRVDVRIIAATHVDLKKRIEDRQFREDLYFRLAGVRLLVPPLRERPGDIRMLIEHFAQEGRRRIRDDFGGFTEAALRAMEAFNWPGNVRQLKMEVFRQVALATSGGPVGRWTPPDGNERERIPLDPREANAIMQDPSLLVAFVRDHDGHMMSAARDLGVSRQQLYRVFKRAGIGIRDIRS